MGRLRELAERSWAAEIEPYELWKPTGATEEIAPGVFFLHAFANVTVVRAEGLAFSAEAKEAAVARALENIADITV